MKKFLNKLRQKNDAEKSLIALVTAVIITFIITTSWLTWTATREKEVVAKESNKTTQVSPFANISGQLGEMKDVIKEFGTQLEESKEILKEIKKISTENSTTTSEIESSTE